MERVLKADMRWVPAAPIPEARNSFAPRRTFQTNFSSLDEALPDTDVLYMTRIQRERFSSEAEYQRATGQHVVTPHLMTRAKRKMIVMHPLPRVDEIRFVLESQHRLQFVHHDCCCHKISSTDVSCFISVRRLTRTRGLRISDRRSAACMYAWHFWPLFWASAELWSPAEALCEKTASEK